MTYPIVPYPALSSAYTTKASRLIDMIVMHATGGSKQGDLYTLSGRDKRHLVSCHYYITTAGEIFQLVQDKDIAWHAGVSAWQGKSDCNATSLGIELENLQRNNDPYPQAQLDAVLWLVRTKVEQYHIPRSRLVRHSEVALPAGRKRDPGPQFPWERFVEDAYRNAPMEMVVLLNDTLVREGPGTSFPVAWGGAAKLYEGREVLIDQITPGESVTRTVQGQKITSKQWAHWVEGGAGQGFIWSGLLRPAEG